MSCIHFKFSNTFENDKIKFDGLHISLGDLKDAIIKQKNLKANLYTLKIIDSQSKKEYTDSQEMLPRNTSVIVSRVPLANAQRIPKSKFKDPTIPQSDSTTSSKMPPPHLPGTTAVTQDTSSNKMLTAEELKKTADLASANATEEDKVMAMISQSGEGYEPSQYVWTRSSGGGMMSGMKVNPPPPSYICYRCGNHGHWIKFCPTNGDPSYNNYRYRRSVGTPSSQIVSVNENVPGAMLDRHGKLVVRAVDLKAVQDYKKKNKQQSQDQVKGELETPPELICSICKELMKDAVIIPCCGESYCYDCIQDYLCENEFTCPSCKKENVSPDNLAPNKALRKSAMNFQMKVAEDKSVAMASGTGFVKKPPVNVPAVVPPPKMTSKSSQLSNSESGEKAGPIAAAETKPAVSATATSESEATKQEAPKLNVVTNSPPALSTAEQDGKEETEAAEDKTTLLSADNSSILSVLKPDKGARSRSGSPANVSSPAAAKMTNEKLIPKHSNLTNAAIPGMLPGVPLTSRLLPQTLGAALAPAPANMLGHQGLFPLMPGMSSMLPGQTTHHPASNSATSSDPTELQRLAAELLLNNAISKKRTSPSPPPLTIDEFYRQKKLLKHLTKHRQSSDSSKSSYMSSDSYSRSSSSDSSYSDSYSSESRSPSRSPLHRTKTSHRHSRKHKLKRDRRGKKHGPEKEKKERRGKARDDREREKVRKEKETSRKHRHTKRRRYEASPSGSQDQESRQKRSRPAAEKKLLLEELAADATNPPPSSSPSPDLAATPPEVQLSGNDRSLSPLIKDLEGSSSQQRHKHKKKRKHKHHRHRGKESKSSAQKEEDVEEELEENKMAPSPKISENVDDALEKGNGSLIEVPKINVEVVGTEFVSETCIVPPHPHPKDNDDDKVEDQIQEDSSTSPLPDKAAEKKENETSETSGGASPEDSPEDGANEPIVSTDNVVAKEMPTAGNATRDEDESCDEMMIEEESIALHADDVLDPSLTEGVETEKKEEAKLVEPAPPPLTIEDLSSVLAHLGSLADWRSLGLELRVPGRKLTQIQQKHPVESLEKVILYWLENAAKENRSWKYLVTALRSIEESAIAHHIIKKYPSAGPVTSAGKEEGEISDSEEEVEDGDGKKKKKSEKANDLPDLRETIASLKPDLRETLNSHKTRKRPAPGDAESGEEGEGEKVGSNDNSDEEEDDAQHFKQPPKRLKKKDKVPSIASSVRGSLMESEDNSDGSRSSSESEEEVKSKSKAKKHRSRDVGRKGTREKKAKKEKKHKHSRDHKRRSSLTKSSHKSKKHSKTEREKREKKLKKHKKSSSHSERSRH